MIECVVLIRWPNGRVDFLSEEDGRMTVFPDRDAAIDCVTKHPVWASQPHQLVELDEL